MLLAKFETMFNLNRTHAGQAALPTDQASIVVWKEGPIPMEGKGAGKIDIPNQPAW